jgi:hypothetical protein
MKMLIRSRSGHQGTRLLVPTGASLTVPSGGLSGQNYPAFEAYLSANQNLTDNVSTKIQFDISKFMIQIVMIIQLL